MSPQGNGRMSAIEKGIAHAEAQKRLLEIANHIAPPAPPPYCDEPRRDGPGAESRCGGCWPCLMAQLREAVNEVQRTAVTFTEVASAVAGEADTGDSDG